MTDMDKMMIEKVAKAIVMAEYSNDTKIVWPIDFSPAEQLMAQRQAIAALTAYNPDDRLREALEPFADFANLTGASYLPDDHVITLGSGYAARQLTMGDCRRARDARSALSPLPQATR